MVLGKAWSWSWGKKKRANASLLTAPCLLCFLPVHSQLLRLDWGFRHSHQGQNVLSPALGGGLFTRCRSLHCLLHFFWPFKQAPDGCVGAAFLVGKIEYLRHVAGEEAFFFFQTTEVSFASVATYVCARPLCSLATPPHTHLRDKGKREEKQPHVSQRRRCAYLDRVRMLGEEAIRTRTKQPRKQQAHMYAREAKTHRKGKREQGTHEALVESRHVCIPFLFSSFYGW